jgi:hypothetical protein
MVLSCAIFFVSCSSEAESTVEPITIVDDCSYLIRISPVTFDVMNTRILFNQISSYSTSTTGAKFYSSCYNDNRNKLRWPNCESLW